MALYQALYMTAGHVTLKEALGHSFDSICTDIILP